MINYNESVTETKQSRMNDTDAFLYFRKLDYDVWYEIDDIPSRIFWTVWNRFIELNSKVELHEHDPMFRKIKKSNPNHL